VWSFIACTLHHTSSGRVRWVGYVARMGEMRNAYKTLVGRRGFTLEDNLKRILREIGWKVVDWIHLAHYRGHCRGI